ncbi:MAG: MBL fold metallo-hydrolase [Saprospiraceae bacterium]|nr:MBL fold metallo-hydrolase [Saprospiraceae bacterium]
MEIQFCGAAREITGSAHLIRLNNGFQILLDCGLYQGHSDSMKSFNEEWYFDPAEIDCVILSHAHIDHSGRLPRLIKDGFSGIIHGTHATRSLCTIMLLDSAHIQQRDAEYHNYRMKKKGRTDELREPLYTKLDVHHCMEQFVGYGYDRWFKISDQVEVLFRDAGHILGSASVTLRIREDGQTRLLGFTGDIGRPRRPILRDPRSMPEVDYLICESTYGDRLHDEAPAETKKFLRIIRETCVENRGKLIIPAFSVGRTQELVYLLDQLETDGQLPRIPVYVDSPLAVNATMIYGSHPECFDNELNEYMLIDDNPFGFNRLSYVRDVEKSKELNESEDPCIIISSAGMINAGRVKHHVYHAIDNPKNTIFLVGYCAPGTPGGYLREGVEELRLFGDWMPVRAKVEIMDSFSAHADRMELLEFLRNQVGSAKEIFLVHGTLDRQESFRGLLMDNGFSSVRIPKLKEKVSLYT